MLRFVERCAAILLVGVLCVPAGAKTHRKPHRPEPLKVQIAKLLADPAVARAVGFLLETQREDGGWGEDNESYDTAPAGRYHRSNPSQTAWALLGLMAAGQAGHAAVLRGVAWLAAQQGRDGGWQEEPYTAVGFPRVFYLRYHGYKLFFPLLALARYRNLRQSNQRAVAWGF